ncbi:MAG TPA: H(+)/Cl(-) exchange transporter ClcA [Deltaproteobacteria bacterium]|nr:H(+)/Cl(-) exchange transporter ClcA [Deltaproteobacteria bacterium]
MSGPPSPLRDLKSRRGHLGGLETEYSPLRIFAWAALVGAGAGMVGAVFRILVHGFAEERGALLAPGGSRGVVSLLLSISATALMTTLALFLVRRFAPEAGGSGVQEIEGALDGVRPLRWQRVLPIKFVSGLLALGGGMVLGREGPTIQIGGNFGKMIADLGRLPLAVERTLVAAGAGAGLSAAFNAPLAGIVFVLEEMRPQFKYTFTSVQAVVIACATADIAVRILTGQGPAISILTFDAPPLASLWLFPLFGAVFGLLGLAFARLLVWTLDRFDSLPGWAHHAVGPIVGGAIGLLAWRYPATVGSGDELIPMVLALPMTAATLLLLFVVRFGTSAVSYGCGAPGGIFAPMLALGTLFGMAYGHSIHTLFPHLVSNPGVFAVAGIGALFTATVRAPITAAFLAIEITANYEQILPLLLTCAAATIVAELLGSKPIYSVLLKRTLARNKAQTSLRLSR